MAHDILLTNARIVTAGEIVQGSLAISGQHIAGLAAGGLGSPSALDLEGDLLLPGLVELHTDNLEKHYSPRAGVCWDPVAAAVGHDVQVAGAGITTVFDSLVLGAASGWDARDEWLRPMLDGLSTARRLGMLKADHRLHWRCEVTHPEIGAMFASLSDEPGLGLVSLMDHAPGDRQAPDIEDYKKRYRDSGNLDMAAVEAHVAELIEGSRRYGPPNRKRVAAHAAELGIAVASHDDAREAHITEAAGLGCVVTEFPTTLAAAQAARAAGLRILMGAPNLIRGVSHSGNVRAAVLAEAGLLDILSSDYIPGALLPAALALTRAPFNLALPAAMATVSLNPARAVGLDDRGQLAEDLRADLLRVRLVEGRPLIKEVWVQGRRVA